MATGNGVLSPIVALSVVGMEIAGRVIMASGPWFDDMCTAGDGAVSVRPSQSIAVKLKLDSTARRTKAVIKKRGAEEETM